MASYQGVNYAKTQASPVAQIEEGQYNSPVLHILDLFVFTADLAANDQVLMGGYIPEGAVLLDAVVSTGALGGSAAINFGWLASAAALAGSNPGQAQDLTAFFSALPVSSATVAKAHGSTYEGDFYSLVALNAAVQPVVSCSVATSGATGKSIMIDISYTKNGG